MTLRRMNSVFLTGATGVLGARILKDLLNRPNQRVFCLVRAATMTEGQERLLRMLQVYDPSLALKADFIERVTPVLGDVSSPYLGIGEAAVLELAQQVDASIHVAASTNLFSKFHAIESVNLGGTRQMIDFALKTKNRYLVYVSTYTVQGDKTFDRSFVFRESDLDVGQGFEWMSYQHTKFLAEQLLHASTERGLVWNIVRPGQIFGDSEQGNYPQGLTNVSGLFYDIFKTIIETKIAFESNAHFDIVPVDYVSKATLFLGLDRPVFFETYHLTNPTIRSYGEIVNMVQSLGYSIQKIPQSDYKELLFRKKLLRFGEDYQSITTKAFRWWFRREGFDFENSAITDATYTVSCLNGSGVACPVLDKDLVNMYIQRGIRDGYFPKPGEVDELQFSSPQHVL